MSVALFVIAAAALFFVAERVFPGRALDNHYSGNVIAADRILALLARDGVELEKTAALCRQAGAPHRRSGRSARTARPAASSPTPSSVSPRPT